jgi:hypothetical protein
LKIDRYIKDLSKELDILSTNGNGKDKDGNEQLEEDWFCRWCHKQHFELADCPQNIFGNGDRWCTLCSKVHYDHAECPNGGKWCTYCDKEYHMSEEQKHFKIHLENERLRDSFIAHQDEQKQVHRSNLI